MNIWFQMVKRSCLLCRKHMDERLLCCTTTKSHHTVVLLSSLVLFNVIDLEEARRCYATCVRMRQRFCNVHYIEAAKFITSEMTYLGIGFASYVDEPRGVVVSYVNEKDIPLHVVDSVQTNAMKLDVELIISKRRICEFLNYCLARFKADEIRAPVCADSADSNQKTVGSPIKTEDHSGDVKPPATEFGTSGPPQVIEAKGDLSAVELYADSEAISPSIKAENDISDVKPPAFPSGTSSAPEMIEVKVDNSVKECVDSTLESQEETNSALLKKVFAVSGERLLTLFRFCPECGTEISRKRSAVLSEEGPSPVVHFVCKNCQGKQSWYGM
ncbi:hypothetical protein ANCCAN_20367 [Ancylostoma caninum]|uniref:Uncharacterized protein n=1 Tax=Ancylostoma caninum TaxID=29170 RepID=A0A368FQM6_ANCCA|nr:hypothetical protein ANCCAN_20367 [Ancylostoma caninum]